MNKIQVLALYLSGINLIAFAVYGLDKHYASKGMWRVRERTLVLMALAGGSIGSLVAMKVFRHKTMKPKFKYGVPFILIAETAALIYLKMKGII